jgi:hypothetical protein
MTWAPGDIFHEVAYTEEIIRCGSVGLASGLGSSAIAVPPILAMGTACRAPAKTWSRNMLISNGKIQ